MDFKGYFATGDGKRCDPFTITDAYSRYLIRCQIVSRMDLSQVRAICEAAMREYGVPARIRTDNGAPFAGTGLLGLSKLSLGWMKLGIVHERIQPGRPQQNGRHERMHRTLKVEVLNPPAATLRCVIVVQHTFSGRLNHNPHLHIMVSAGGLDAEQVRWIESIHFDHDEIMALWRLAVTTYLEQAHRSGLLNCERLPGQFQKVIEHQAVRKWNIHITRVMSKHHFLGYAGRYIRRLPISQRRILTASETEVVYQVKDTRAKTICEARSTPVKFVALLWRNTSRTDTGIPCAILAYCRRERNARTPKRFSKHLVSASAPAHNG
jgi:transposase InsO family protein